MATATSYIPFVPSAFVTIHLRDPSGIIASEAPLDRAENPNDVTTEPLTGKPVTKSS